MMWYNNGKRITNCKFSPDGITPHKGVVRFMNLTVPFLRVKKQPIVMIGCTEE